MIFEGDIETGSAFIAGQEAHELGAVRSDCPYPSTERGDERPDELREQWLAGWDHADGPTRFEGSPEPPWRDPWYA